MKYIAYYKKDPLYLEFKTANALVLTRFECGIDLVPNPQENELFVELLDEKAIIFPSEFKDDTKALMLKIDKDHKSVV